MKKIIFGFLICVVFVISCGKNEKAYDLIEKALISILDRKSELQILKELNKAMKTSEEDAFSLTYLYFGNSEPKIFDKYLGKSKGNAEYYKGLLMKTNKEPLLDILNMFETSASQGNKKAYYMLGKLYQDNLEFSKGQEYYKVGKEKGEMYSTYAYYFNENLKNEYEQIDKLKIKLEKNIISEKEKKELGRIILEKFSNYELAYEILKEFLPEGYEPALYAKSKLLEKENNFEDSFKIHKELYFVNDYYLGAYEIAQSLVKKENNYKLALDVLNGIKIEDGEIEAYKGYLYERIGNESKAQKYYLRAAKKNDVAAMGNLGKYYEYNNKVKKAKEIYKKAYGLGSINSGYRLAILLENGNGIEKADKKLYYNKEARRILEKLSENGDENSIIQLSNYYSDDSNDYRIINLKGSVKLNNNALYNLGVYYYNRGNDKKSKLYLKRAKELGYEIGEKFEKYIK